MQLGAGPTITVSKYNEKGVLVIMCMRERASVNFNDRSVVEVFEIYR